MKNQFIISESEKESILRLHKQSTKQQYLNVLSEQETPAKPVTLIDIQNTLIGLGHKVSKNGIADGKLGPMTLSAIATALKGVSATPQGSQPQQGVNVIDELMKIPEVKAIADKLKAANIDLSKMKPEEILPKVQELAGDVLTANPNLLNTVKTQIETLLKIKLPDITPSQNNVQGNVVGGTENLKEVPGAGQKF
jgi:hypothetical protein